MQQHGGTRVSLEGCTGTFRIWTVAAALLLASQCEDQSGRKLAPSTFDWKQPHTISSILDEDDGATFEFSRALR